MAVSHTKDHEIKIGSTTKRLNLVRDENGQKMYRIVEDIPNYQDPLTFTQEDWSGGHGQHTMRNPSKYFEGQSIDTMTDGVAFLGPAINEVPVTNSSLTLRPNAAGDETNIGHASPDTGEAHYEDVDEATSDEDVTFVYEDDDNYLRDFYNITTGTINGTITGITVYARCRATTAPTQASLKICIKTGGTAYEGAEQTVTTSYANYTEAWATNPGGGAWSQANINDLQIGISMRKAKSSFPSNISTRCTQVWVVVTSTLDTTPVCFIWFPAVSKWLMATAAKIWIYNSSTTSWDAATTTVARVTQFQVFGATCFAARSQATPGTWAAGDEYYYSTDGDTWTASTLTDLYAYKFLIAPNSTGTADILWKIKTPNELSNNTSGINGGAQWSTPAYIGDTANNVTTPFISSDQLLVGRTDGLWWYDSDGGIHQLRPDLRTSVSTDNFKYVTSWQGASYHSEINGLSEILGASYDLVGPTNKIEDIGKRGTVVGLAADKDYLYVAMDEGTNTHIYKCRQGKEWSYCPFVFLSTNSCAAIEVCQHTTTDRRLWFGYGSSTAYVTLSDNPLADSLYRYTTSGLLRMSYTYGTDSNWDKLFQSAVLEVERVDSGAKTTASSGETISVSYRKDTDTSATSIISAATTLGIYESNFSSALNNKRIQYQLNFASDTSTATPVVTYFQAKGVEKPTTVRVHEATYEAGDDISTRTKTIKDFLEGGRTNTSLIKFADLRLGQKTTGTASGDYVWVVMEPGYPKIVEISHTKSQQPEIGIQCRFREVSFTIS